MAIVPTQSATRSATEIMAGCRLLVQPALRRAVGKLPAAMQEIVGYHYGWLDEFGQPVAGNSGKTLRSTLTLLAAAAVGTSENDLEVAVPAAVAVELVHDFSLLHDDVMDGDLTRRHRPTAWSVFGVGPAILAGDALLILAMDTISGSGFSGAQQSARMLSGSVQELVEGQICDLAFERRDDVGLTECLAMAEAKTGSLLGTAGALGAVFGGGRPAQIDAFAQFGREMGVAFQLIDDLIGIWGDPAQTGKPVNSDLRSRKKSLPVVAALASGTAAGRALGELYHGESELSEDELGRAAELIELAGGRAWCQDRADQLLQQAQDRIAAISPASQAIAELRVLAGLMTDRTH